MTLSEILRRVVAMKLSRQKMIEVLTLIADVNGTELGAQLDPQNDPQVEHHDPQNDPHGTELDAAKVVPPVPDKERVSQTLPKEINPSPPFSPARTRKTDPETEGFLIEFEHQFWPAYPHKVGKPDAQVSFVKARKGVRIKGKPKRQPASLEAILAGVGRYIDAAQVADRAWLNPATFLNQERFNDDPAEQPHRSGKPADDAILRALARRASAGNGVHERQADPDGGLFPEPRSEAGSRTPVVELPAKDVTGAK